MNHTLRLRWPSLHLARQAVRRAGSRPVKVFEEVRGLYDGTSNLPKEFFDNIRLLNSIFSFTSLGISRHFTREQAIQTNGTLGGFSVVIHGQLFHQINPLLPREGTKRTGSEIMLFDSQWE